MVSLAWVGAAPQQPRIEIFERVECGSPRADSLSAGSPVRRRRRRPSPFPSRTRHADSPNSGDGWSAHVPVVATSRSCPESDASDAPSWCAATSADGDLRYVRLARVTDEEEVKRIEAELRHGGWADHTGLVRELRAWGQLAAEVNDYPGSVDDYTNDLCSRDYLQEMEARASFGLRSAINQRVAPIDLAFRGATIEDTDGRLARFFRIESCSGWWWRRRPSSGPLAQYLALGN